MKTPKLLVCLLIVSFMHAQLPSKFGKVSNEELTRKASKIDPEAAAEILQESVTHTVAYVNDEDQFNTEKQYIGRIKIYNKENTSDKLLNIKIPLYDYNSTRDVLMNFKVSVYNLVDGKVEEVKMSKRDLIKERVNKYRIVKKMALKGIKDGSVIEYKYKIDDPGYELVDRWFFQDEVPTVYSEFNISYPEFFVYSRDLRGAFKPESNNVRRKNFKYDFQDNFESYVYKNLPALNSESFVTNPDNLRASIKMELIEYNNPGFGYKSFSTSWKQISKALSNHEKVWGQLKGNSFLDEKVNSLVAGLTSPEQKIETIFKYVKANTQHDGFIGIYADKGVRKTFKEGKGNSADINLLLAAMLQKAGIEANPVVLSTVQYGVLSYTYPSLRSLNHVIVGAHVGENGYLMDAIDDFSHVNLLPLNDLNDRGFEIKENGTYSIVPLTNRVFSEESTTAVVSLNEDLSAEGKLITTHKKYFGMLMAKKKVLNPESLKKEIKNKYSCEESEIKVEINDAGDAVKCKMKINLNDAYLKVDDKIFLNPLLFLATENNPFKAEKRDYQIEFATPYGNQSLVRIKIPEGYSVTELPEKVELVLPNNVGSYVYTVKEKKGMIEARAIVVMRQPTLPPSYYPSLKEFFGKIIESQTEQIVLQKQNLVASQE